MARVCEGFIGNRIYSAYRTQCEFMLEEGALPADVDAAITSFGFAMGPFRVADMSGLDTVVKVARDMREAYGDRFYVHKGMEERLDRGELGAKSGKGFYEHS